MRKVCISCDSSTLTSDGTYFCGGCRDTLATKPLYSEGMKLSVVAEEEWQCSEADCGANPKTCDKCSVSLPRCSDEFCIGSTDNEHSGFDGFQNRSCSHW